MKRKPNRFFWTTLSAALMLCFVGILVWNHIPYYHAGRLISAIHENDVQKVEQILRKHPKSANTPSGNPKNKLWYGLTESAPDAPLTVACYLGNEEIVALLLQYGADPNGINGTDWTPLLRTLSRYDASDRAIVALLLQYGADPNYSAGNSDTPLELAARLSPFEQKTSDGEAGEKREAFDLHIAGNITEIAELLVQAGANLERTTAGMQSDDLTRTFSLTELATESGNYVLLRFCIERLKLNVNSQDTLGRSAAHGLAYFLNAHPEQEAVFLTIYQILLDHQIDFSQADCTSETPYDIARAGENKDFAAYLKP